MITELPDIGDDVQVLEKQCLAKVGKYDFSGPFVRLDYITPLPADAKPGQYEWVPAKDLCRDEDNDMWILPIPGEGKKGRVSRW